MTHNAYNFRYRVCQWHHYNQALIGRGGITFWIDKAALTTWRNTQGHSGAGARRIYSDTAIQGAVVVKSVYHFIVRAAQGFVSSVMSLMRLDLPVPNYSTVCRRQGSLKVPILSSPNNRPRHIVIDATGLRVYGAGEWSVHEHRGSRRQIWRKLHLGFDKHTKEIVAVEITASHVHDNLMLPSLLMQIPGKVYQVSGDEAYDTKACYESAGQSRAKATIPPRRIAKRMKCSNPPEKLALRDTNLRHIQQQGRYGWCLASGGTQQSLEENAVFPFNALFGPKLRARRFKIRRGKD